MEIDEFYGRMTNMTFEYEWKMISAGPVVSPSSLSSIAPSSIPSLTLTDYPSASPTIDTCNDCTLNAFISGGTCETLYSNITIGNLLSQTLLHVH